MMGVFGAAFPFFSSSSLSQHSQVAVSGTYAAYWEGKKKKRKLHCEGEQVLDDEVDGGVTYCAPSISADAAASFFEHTFLKRIRG